MDVTDPATALAGGLTMPLLRTLSHRASPATASQLRRTAGAGTESGVKRALERLAQQGVLTAEDIGDRVVVYSLNRDHVLYPAVTALLAAAEELPHRLRAEIATWQLQPAAAALYGSAARRDGDSDSDIDLLLLRPAGLTSRDRERWAEQVYTLRQRVERWTGNRCQITDRPASSLRRLARGGEPIVQEWRKDAVPVGGADVRQLAGQW